eukprot:jgi/Tetstr1/441285/TSEL_029536.t1
MMEGALNLCERKLKHNNIKTAAFERLPKVLKKHMLPKDGLELSTETWYHVEQCLNVPVIKKTVLYRSQWLLPACNDHRHGDSLDCDRNYDDRRRRCNLTR